MAGLPCATYSPVVAWVVRRLPWPKCEGGFGRVTLYFARWRINLEAGGRKQPEQLTRRDETHLSAQQSAAKADARVSRPDGIARRTPCAQAASHQGPPSIDRFDPAQAARLDS